MFSTTFLCDVNMIPQKNRFGKCRLGRFWAMSAGFRAVFEKNTYSSFFFAQNVV